MALADCPPAPAPCPPTVLTEADEMAIATYIHQLEGYARVAWAACGSLR